MGAEVATYWLSWIRLVQLIAVLLVAVGVVAEFASEWLSRPLEKVIDAARELRIAELNNETARLQKIVTGRQLSNEQIASIAEAIKGFGGHKVYLGSYSGDAEGARFAGQLKKALDDAGIVVDPSDNLIGQVIVGIGLAGWGGLNWGIHLQGTSGDDGLMDAITSALAENGQFKIENRTRPAMIREGRATLGVMVGLRPL